MSERRIFGANDVDYCSEDDEEETLEVSEMRRIRAEIQQQSKISTTRKPPKKPRRALMDGSEAKTDNRTVELEFNRFGIELAQIRTVEDLQQIIGPIIQKMRIKIEDAKAMLSATFGFLRLTYSPNMELRVALIENSKELEAIHELNFIRIGAKIVTDFSNDDTSGYRLEREPFSRFVQDKEGALLWFVLHEFCHLIAPHEQHSTKFFNRVEKMASECICLFKR